MLHYFIIIIKTSTVYLDNFCGTYFNVEDIPNSRDLYIGYSNIVIFYITIPIISLIINVLVIVLYFIKRKKSLHNKNSIVTIDVNKIKGISTLFLNQNKETKIELLDKMILSNVIIQTISSINWIVNYLLFKQPKDIQANCYLCYFFSICNVFITSFDWIFFGCSLWNLKNILQNPFENIKFKTKLFYSLLISFFGAFMYSLHLLLTNNYGVSPILTCFIKNKFDDKFTIPLYVAILLPIIYFIVCLYICEKIFKLKKLISNVELKTNTIKLMIYALVYFVLYLPLFLLYIFTINYTIRSKTFLSYLSYYSSLSIMSVNLVFGTGKLIEVYSSINLRKLLKIDEEVIDDLKSDNKYEYNSDQLHFNNKKERKSSSLSNSIEEEQLNKLINNGFIFNFNPNNRNIIDNFIRDLFIGIIISLDKSKKKVKSIENNFENNLCNNTILHSIDSSKSDYSYIIKYKLQYCVSKIPVIINITEYSPEIFKRLRKIDNVSESEIIYSLLSSDISALTSNQGGASGALFLPTKDNKFLIKTMDNSDYITMKSNSFLTYYTLHFINNPCSLICRFYGIYSVKAEEDGRPFRLLLMRNLKGPFNNLINASYDLKGSTINRYVNIDDIYLNCRKFHFKVRKDINFNKEVGFMDLKDKHSFIKNIESAALFFKDQGIIDYSLFIYQLQFTSDELKELFDDNNTNYKYYNNYFYLSNKYIVETKEHVGYACMIIDYLQKYTLNKMLEKNFKQMMKSGNSSSASPHKYYIRFFKYCASIAGNLDNKNNNNSIYDIKENSINSYIEYD